jgi:TDG/mug DNA glycosylase family protein
LKLQAFKFKLSKPDLSETFSAAATARRPAGGASPDHLPPKQKRRRSTAPIAGGLPELLGDAPLRLIIVGHNPSEVSFHRGHFYANPTNWMWRILRETAIAPEAVRGADDDRLMPALAGVGFTDVGSGVPGTDSSQFTAADFAAWRQPFFERLGGHARRAAAAVDCTCGRRGAPAIVAFAGKRQFAELFSASSGGGGQGRGRSAGGGAPSAAADGCSSPAQTAPVRVQAARPASIQLGRQTVLPAGWPLPLDSTEVWVLCSTSGAAPMTRAQRFRPWLELAQCVQQEAWPVPSSPCRCIAPMPD